jgi:hypothetical protein
LISLGQSSPQSPPSPSRYSIQPSPPQRSQRQFKALEKALEDGNLVIVNSPAVYLTDRVDGSRDQIVLSSNTLGVAAPVGIPTASSSSSM